MGSRAVALWLSECLWGYIYLGSAGMKEKKGEKGLEKGKGLSGRVSKG